MIEAEQMGARDMVGWIVSRIDDPSRSAEVSKAIDARFDDYTVDGTSLQDNRVPGVSPHRLDGSLLYEAPFGWFASLEGRYQDNLPVNDRNTAVSPAFIVVDFRTGLEEIGGNSGMALG